MRVGEEKRQATDFRETECCTCAVVQRVARKTNEACRSAQDNLNSRKGQQPFRLTPNGVGDRTTRLRRLLIGADYCDIDSKVVFFQID